jgi:DNA-binding FrmR family transcriptional regulator
MSKEKALINFKKATSLLERIIKMTEEDAYCVDIMQQNMAVIGMLKSSHQLLMENHLKTCFRNSLNSSSKKLKDQMTDEILKVVKLAQK